MAKRKRDMQLNFRVSAEELAVIEQKMSQFGTSNREALPSALKMRIRPSAPAVTGVQMQMMPSAPMEKWRRERSCERAAMFSGTPLSRQSR